MLYPTDPKYKEWLHSHRWHRLRLAYLIDHPFCEECLLMHRRTPATEVHHKQPVLSFPSQAEQQLMMFNSNNLMALCHSCHLQQHDRRLQKANQQQRAENRLQAFINKYK